MAQGSGGWYDPPTKRKRKRDDDAPLEPQSDPNPPQAGPAFEPQADTQNYRIAALIERQRLQAMEDDDEEVLMLLL